MTQPSTLIVGIGGPHGDDQAGWLAANRLATDLDEDAVAVRKAATPAELIDWLGGVDWLVLCDACHGLGRVGEVRRWTWPASELSDASWSGTHNLPLPAVLKLAEQLGRLPKKVVIWSIEGAAVGALATVSPEVAAALPELVENIANEVNQDKRCMSGHL